MSYFINTNLLLLKSKALEFFDLVRLLTAQMTYKSRNNLLPGHNQECSLKERKES